MERSLLFENCTVHKRICKFELLQTWRQSSRPKAKVIVAEQVKGRSYRSDLYARSIIGINEVELKNK